MALLPSKSNQFWLAAALHLLLPNCHADETQDYYADPQYALLYPWLVIILGVAVAFSLQQLELKIPYAAVMFTVGMFMGIGAFRLGGQMEQLNTSIRQWSDIDSQVLLLVFLPGLIFRDALIEVNVLTFTKCLGQLLIFAFPMVLVGTVLTAVACIYILPVDFFDWSLALTVGAILASTDPVAVASVLQAADAPPRLQMHIGGESMLNDGAAVVFYVIFSQQFLANLLDGDADVSIGQGIATFFRMSLGGVAVGLAFAIGLLVLLYELDRRLEKENNVLQVAAAVSVAYLSYYVSEQVCQMSGVIACVTAGITVKAWGHGLITDPDLMDSYLKLVENLLNTLLFTLGGTVFGEVIANSEERAYFTWTEWSSLGVLYVAVMIIRGIQVLLFYPIISRIGLKTNWREMFFFGFAGLRGAVGIALALSLDRTVREDTLDEDKRAITSTVVGLAGGVSFLTLMINGTLAGWVLRQLNLVPPVTSRKRALRLFEATAREVVLNTFSKLRREQTRFAGVNFLFVKDHLPFMSGVTNEDLGRLDAQTASQFFQIHTTSQYGTDDEVEDTAPKRLRTSTTDEFVDSIRAGATDCPEEIKSEIREIFLKILDAAYLAELSRGALDKREDNGLNLEVLRQSIVFSVGDCRRAQYRPMNDWKYITMNTFHDGLDVRVQRLVEWVQENLFKMKRGKGSTQEYQNLRVRVLRTLVFIEAHRRADMEIRSYLDSVSGSSRDISNSSGVSSLHLESAILSVLEESDMQVLAAENWLETAVEAEDFQSIRSHYMVTILLHKLELFVEKAVAEGKLKEKEGRIYLKTIDERVKKVHVCTRTHQEERRRRRKQKSTGSTASSTEAAFFRPPQGL